MNKPVKHLDLPKYHLSGEHYVPARARQADEIERRRSLPHGTVLLEQQRDGLAIIRHIVERAEDEPDLAYIKDMLAACALNSSWYTYAQHTERMRRCLVSPELIDAETGEPRTPTDMRAEAEAHLALTVEAADALVDARIEGRLTPRRLFDTGREMGTTALRVVALSLDDSVYSLDPMAAAWHRREQELATLSRARTLIGEVGSNVSAAPLADPDSELSGYVRRTATNNVYESFEEATEELRHAA